MSEEQLEKLSARLATMSPEDLAKFAAGLPSVKARNLGGLRDVGLRDGGCRDGGCRGASFFLFFFCGIIGLHRHGISWDQGNSYFSCFFPLFSFFVFLFCCFFSGLIGRE